MSEFKVTKRCLLVMVVFVAFVCSGFVFGADWANWRGPEHNGISAEKDWNPAALKDGAKIVWKASVGTGFSSISIAEGRAYTMGNIDDTDHVFCLDAKTGKEIWNHSYKHPLDAKYYEGGTSSTPTVAGGKVYTVSKRGIVFCLDAKTGDVVWEKQLDSENASWGLAGSPVIFDDVIVYNAAEFGIALDKTTGKVVWQNGKGSTGYSTPVPYMAGNVKAAVLFGANGVFAVEVATGKKIWEADWKTQYGVNAADPIISGDNVFITSGYGTGCALLKIDGNKASRVWGKEKVTKDMQSQMSGPVLWKDNVYGINQKELACVDFKTGKSLWTFGEVGNGSVMIAGGNLVVLSEKGKLYIAELSPAGFKEISSAEILKGKCWSPPAFSNGMIYARTSTGDLVCVDVSK